MKLRYAAAGMHRVIAALFVCFFANSAAQAQTPFDPHTVAYVLCVTSETKTLALAVPALEKDTIVTRAFTGCNDVEAEARKALAVQGMNDEALDQRFLQIRKFIRQTAEDDIDRQRVNRVPR